MWLLLAAAAHAAPPAWSVSYRPVVGASFRVEGPAIPGWSTLAEAGFTALWLPDPFRGTTVGLRRPHLRLGADWHPSDRDSGLYLGPRLVTAVSFPDTGLNVLEAGVQGVVGWKAITRGGVLLQAGLGAGAHWLERLSDGEQRTAPLPVVELRIGHRMGGASPSAPPEGG